MVPNICQTTLKLHRFPIQFKLQTKFNTSKNRSLVVHTRNIKIFQSNDTSYNIKDAQGYI